MWYNNLENNATLPAAGFKPGSRARMIPWGGGRMSAPHHNIIKEENQL